MCVDFLKHFLSFFLFFCFVLCANSPLYKLTMKCNGQVVSCICNESGHCVTLFLFLYCTIMQSYLSSATFVYRYFNQNSLVFKIHYVFICFKRMIIIYFRAFYSPCSFITWPNKPMKGVLQEWQPRGYLVFVPMSTFRAILLLRRCTLNPNILQHHDHR